MENEKNNPQSSTNWLESLSVVLIAGFGISGHSVRDILAEHSVSTISVDEKVTDADMNTFDTVDWDTVDLVVVSPAFPPSTPFILTAQKRHIPVISEVEFAWRVRVDVHDSSHPAPWIGITGTNGKTTTTQMTSAMLMATGLVAPAVGNIGVTVSSACTDPANEAFAVELSSSQLHFTDSLELESAVITNIAQDHIDWHDGFENYIAAKAKIYHQVTKAIVYNVDDSIVSSIAREVTTRSGCAKIGFTLGVPTHGQLGVDSGWIVSYLGESPLQLVKLDDLDGLKDSRGVVFPHLIADALAALALCLGAGYPAEPLVGALMKFAPGAHKIQHVESTTVRSRDGREISVRFFDDSKATNAHATVASVKSFSPHSVIWIVGGLAKGGHFEDLVSTIHDWVVGVVVIGVDQSVIEAALEADGRDLPQTVIPPQSPDVMGDAVAASMELAQTVDIPGDEAVVLLAPACASMDQFTSYADRGDKFASAARQWVNDAAQ
jgi:UDP-N-acetylmuramoylalanine--D-glutamate ligase